MSIDVTEAMPLTCDTIGELDNGIARVLVDAAIQHALNDLEDRAEKDGKSRKVVIEIEFGLHDGLPFTNVSAQAKIPPRRSKNTGGKLRMKSKGNQQMLFQPHNPERADQPTFKQED